MRIITRRLTNLLISSQDLNLEPCVSTIAALSFELLERCFQSNRLGCAVPRDALPVLFIGWPGRTRTCAGVLNRHLPYHLATGQYFSISPLGRIPPARLSDWPSVPFVSLRVTARLLPYGHIMRYRNRTPFATNPRQTIRNRT
jgi:hypothetical protein